MTISKSNSSGPNVSGVFYRNMFSDPVRVVRGSGVYLEDDQGRDYLDGNASASVVGIGHGRTEIAQALAEAGDRVTFVYNGTFTHPWQEDLAKAVLSVAPENMSAVYFVSGGSEANESAMKLVRQHFVERGLSQKYKAIARWQSYHGVTMATLSLSGRTTWRSLYSPYLLPITHIMPPYEYRCPLCAEHRGCSLACADDLERAILLEGPETVAMFFAEPVGGTTATGLVPHPDYYARVREICDKYDVLLVVDEVLCGYGRTGRPFAIQHWNVEPDIMTLGKAMGSGYAPLGAMVASEKVLAPLREGSGRFIHGFTYSGTPSSCFVGLKVFEIMQREALFTRPEKAGIRLFRKLETLAERHEVIGEIRGKGLLIGLEFVADRETRQPFPKETAFSAKVVAAMRRRGVILAAGIPLVNFGKDGDHIQISPPFIINDEDIEVIVDALDEALTEVTLAV